MGIESKGIDIDIDGAFDRESSMSMRSYIGIVNDDGKCRAIYCHWDGYPQNVGYKLFHHYQDVNKINALIDLGGISSLGFELSSPTWKTMVHNASYGDTPTTAYHRDWGEKLDIEEDFQYEDDKYIEQLGVDYVYVFLGGKWMYRKAFKKDEFKVLTKEVTE